MAELPDAAFRAMVERSVSPFVVVDDDGVVVWVGPRVEQLLHEAPEAFVGRHFLDLIHPSSHEAAISAFSDFVRHQDDGNMWVGPPLVIDLVRHDGTIVPCEIGASSGAPMGIAGAVLQVRRSRGTPLLYDAVDALAIGAPIADVLGRLALLAEHDTPGSAVVVGWGWDGERFRSVAPDGPLSLDRDAPTPWHAAMAANEPRGGNRMRDEYPDIGADAEDAGYSTCWVLPITIRDADVPTAALILWRQTHGDALPHRTTTAGRVARLVAMAIESDRNARALREAADTDPLTGLPNRSAHRRALVGLVDAKPDTTDLSVLFCDLDGFKPVNDRHGHDFGDRVLRIVGERMRATVRSSDHVSRWGGDEFLVSTLAGNLDEVTGLADRLIERVSQPIVLDGVSLQVGMSIGIATSTALDSVDSLVQHADDALLEAKEEAGPNHWILHN